MNVPHLPPVLRLEGEYASPAPFQGEVGRGMGHDSKDRASPYENTPRSFRAADSHERRRELLQRAGVLVLAATVGVPTGVLAQNASTLNLATIPAATRKAIETFTQGKPIRTAQPDDAFKIDVAELAENGHTVPVGLSIAKSAKAFALFTEANPQPDVAIFRLPEQSANAAKTQMSTRIRLAMTQRFWCIAQVASGEFVAQSANVVVTLAACIEE